MNRTRQIAIHEASHAVVAHVCGARILGVTARKSGGLCTHVGGVAEIDAAVALAGAIGESMFCGDCIGRVSDGDERILAEALSKTSEPEETQCRAEASARRILGRSRGIVLSLADELEQRKSLSGPEVRAIIDGSAMPQSNVRIHRHFLGA